MELLRRIFIRVLHISPIAKFVQNHFHKLITNKQVTLSVEDARKHIHALSSKPNTHACYEEALEPQNTDVVLSVIIPFYNAEQYANECIQSVAGQKTRYKYEIIFVDDGSPDKCGEICESWADNYDNIKVIHQKNAGVAIARNTGIKNSVGKYVMFLDSDDCLCDDAIEILLSKAIGNDADIVEGSYQILVGNTKKTRKGIYHENKEGKFGESMYGFPWGKVFKRDLFLQFCFPGNYWFEDTIIANLVFPLAKKTITVSDCIVKYRITTNGLTAQSKKNAKCLDIYYIMEEIFDIYSKYPIQYKKQHVVRQLGQYLYIRCRVLKEKDVQAVFIMAADLASKFELDDRNVEYSFYEEQMLQALIKRQYWRWKWASILI